MSSCLLVLVLFLFLIETEKYNLHIGPRPTFFQLAFEYGGGATSESGSTCHLEGGARAPSCPNVEPPLAKYQVQLKI